MKKILVTGLLFCSFLSCKSQIAENLDNFKIYEDTIQIEFVDIDSLIFKNKDHRYIADSLRYLCSGVYNWYDIKSLETGKIHRIIFERKKFYGISPFDEKRYRIF